MGKWNKQSSKNNNLQPDIPPASEQLANIKIQQNIQELIGMEAIGQEEKNVKPQGTETIDNEN